jgi:pimeloyl-ACP methyl ester carboxylesterase
VPRAPLDLRRERADFERDHARREAGRAVRYLSGGAGGAAVLLLPGYFVGAESWFPVQARLEPDHRVVAVEYPAVETVDALFEGLERVLAEEGVEDVHVVGQSIGALYARALVPRWGSRVRSLALLHGSLPRATDLARVRRGVLLGRLAPAFVHRYQWTGRVAAERPGDDSASVFWRELLLERARSLAKRDAVAWGACYADLLARGAPPREAFERWGGPVLLLGSEDDPVVDRASRRALADFHGGATEVDLPGAGHLSPELRPDEVADAIAAHVARASA